MNTTLKSTVLFCPAEPDSLDLGFDPRFQELIRKAAAELVGTLPGDSCKTWSFKIPLGEPGQPNHVLPEWMESIEAGLGLGPFQVGESSHGSSVQELALPEGSSLSCIGLSPVAAETDALVLLNSVRPHPHLGMSASLFTLGSGLVDRDTRIRMHRDVRPSVDAALCAGCGSCLGACLFDAIDIRAGRAYINHQQCTGCGDCMTACHLAGISPDDAAGIVAYQKLMAEAAYAVATGSRAGLGGGMLHVNFLTPLSQQEFGGSGKDRFLKGTYGVLFSVDPVALDQATWDLLVKGAVHSLRQWSGFMQEPGLLMEWAETLGLGSRQYLLETFS